MSWPGSGIVSAALGCGARGAALTFAVAPLLAATVLPYDSWQVWTRTVFAAGRVGHPEDTANQALRGVLARLLHTPEPGVWRLAPAAVTGALGLAVAVAAELRGRRGSAMAACAVTALLVCPVSWSHHWAWCVSMVLVTATARRRAVAVGMALVFCSYALWWVPHGPGRLELRQNGVELTVGPLCGGRAALPGPHRRRDAQAVTNE